MPATVTGLLDSGFAFAPTAGPASPGATAGAGAGPVAGGSPPEPATTAYPRPATHTPAAATDFHQNGIAILAASSPSFDTAGVQPPFRARASVIATSPEGAATSPVIRAGPLVCRKGGDARVEVPRGG